MFIVAAMFVAATMVACCGNQNTNEGEKACCEQKAECDKAECKGECDKTECKGECDKAECKGKCDKAEATEAPAAETPAAETPAAAETK